MPYFGLKRKLIKFLQWVDVLRHIHLTHQQFVYVLALVVGIISGLYALLIVKMTVWVNEILINGLFNEYSFYYFLFPALGFLLTYIFLRYFIHRSGVMQGMSATLLAITKGGRFKEWFQPFLSLIAVPLTVGLGGSAGIEGPIVVSGASFSERLSDYFKINRKTRVLLIGCAAVGAMSSLFKAPMAAIVFAIEVFALDFTLGSMVPLLISSITAILTSYFFSDDDILFPVRIIGEFSFVEINYYILLGLFTGLMSLFFTYSYSVTEAYFKRNNNPLLKILIGGTVIGVIVYFFPAVFGEGADEMNAILRGEGGELIKGTYFEQFSSPLIIIIFILSIGILKTVATATTLGAGGVGGIFGPTLFVGTAIGNGFAKILNLLGVNAHETNFTLVGMCGLLAGVIHAPLTAIFLTAEISNGYTLIVPLMIVAAMSFSINRYYFPLPFYKQELAESDNLTTHNKDENALQSIQLDDVINNDYVLMYDIQYLGDLVDVIGKSKKNVFPVINVEKQLLGVILLSEMRSYLLEAQLYGTLPLTDIMTIPSAFVYYERDNMKDVMQKFDSSGQWMLPVIRNGVFYGMISKSSVLNLYRNQLREGEVD